jgi:DNA-binding FrmR family transcriptional regulator
MQPIQQRLRRLTGQIEALEAAISTEVPCSEVIPQLLAVKGALDAVVALYLEQSLDRCVTDGDTTQLKTVIKTLIKHQ